MELAAVILFLALLPSASSIKCYKCDHIEVSSDSNVVVKAILNQISKLDHPACKLDDIQSDKYDVDVVECPQAADPGKRFVCGTVRGTVTTSITIASFDWKTVSRDCIQVPSEDSAYDDKCVTGSTVSPYAEALLRRASEGIDLLDVDEFSGQTCYKNGIDDKSVPYGASMCVSCSWNKLETDNSVLGPVLNLFSRISSDDCLMQSPDDRYVVGQRACPKPPNGHETRCAVINGEVTATLGGIEFKYKTQDRGCVSGPPSDFQQECQTQLPSSGTVRGLITDALDGVGAGEPKFDGVVCYNTNGFGHATSQGLVGSATRPAGSIHYGWVLGLAALILLGGGGYWP